jgi:hypothetical protein
MIFIKDMMMMMMIALTSFVMMWVDVAITF